MTNQIMQEVNMEAGKAIIVGGGLGGLATAALLAKAGLSVTVYEKTQGIGGRTVCKKMRDYWLDQDSIRSGEQTKGQQLLSLRNLVSR